MLPSSSIFGGFADELFHPESHHLDRPDITAIPFLTKIERDPDMILRRSSPCYEITENDNLFQLAIDVPGVKMKDITVEFLDHDHVLRISGGRKVHQKDKDGTVVESESKFVKRFVMDQSVDTTKVTANLKDGVLTINAPKDTKPKTTKIAITED